MIFETVRDTLAEQFEIDPSEITMDTNLIDDIGADSLDVVELISAKAKNVQPGELITLEIDTAAAENADLFKYSSQDRYFRIAAMAEGNGYNQASDKFYNFSPIYKFKADFSAIEEVQWDEIKWE